MVFIIFNDRKGNGNILKTLYYSFIYKMRETLTLKVQDNISILHMKILIKGDFEIF